MPTAFLLLVGLVAAAPAPKQPLNTLTDAEKKDGWTLLFDGSSFAGWRQLGFGKVPENKWAVRGGVLVHEAVKGTAGEDLIFEKPFENFELSWEWRVPKAQGNSGVKYRVQETKGKGGAYGPEYQMMNDPGAIDKHATSSLYDLIPPTNPQLAPAAEFNRSRIVVQGDHVEHWLNGRKTVDFTFWDDAFNKAYAASKFAKKKDPWGKPAKGYIALTDHGDEAQFRNIKLRELTAE